MYRDNKWLSFCFCMILILTHETKGLKLPNCSNVEYFEPSSLNCRPCPANTSMITSDNGVYCMCESHSVLTKSGHCTLCNVTETVSADGSTCVPRKCQTFSNRIVCRKCPKDNILLTQNNDGSPLKEVLCVKCTRGYEVRNNACVKCESCACSKSEIIVRGKCLPEKYVAERPKYVENQLHPSDLLDIVKNEYMCVINNVTACRWLANACVGNFYSSDPGGPCRLWFYPNLVKHKLLPMLTANKSDHEELDEIFLSRGQNSISITAVSCKEDGSFQYLSDTRRKPFFCFPPFNITVGEDYSEDCTVKLSELSNMKGELVALYATSEKKIKPLSILLRKPNNHFVLRGKWPANKFTKYFQFRHSLSPTSNMTNLIYLRNFLINLRIERKKQSSGSLKAFLSLEAHYAIKSSMSDVMVTSLKIVYDLPNAGVDRGLEIWGSILCVLMVCYAVTQWRGVVRREGYQISIIPIMAGCISDALYFATWSSVIHALAAEAGTLALTLPLSKSEEQLIAATIYAVVILKAMKAVYIHWILCRCDMFLIDWSEYNQCPSDVPIYSKSNSKKRSILAREWALMQTKRRTSPKATVILTLLAVQLMTPWVANIPKSRGYNWGVSVIAWWCSYAFVFLGHVIKNRLFGCPSNVLQKVCVDTELSLLVFQEDLYAHYVDGRNNDAAESRYLSGPLSTCRVACSAQFRTICKQLMATKQCTFEKDVDKEDLTSRFLAAFFERALDGLSWVASERTVLEKLLDVEILVREGGSTSVLLYDAENSKLSCFAVTWWGNEWTFATLDSMIFGSVLYATREPIYAAFANLMLWQITKSTVAWFGNKNVKGKMNVEYI